MSLAVFAVHPEDLIEKFDDNLVGLLHPLLGLVAEQTRVDLVYLVRGRQGLIGALLIIDEAGVTGALFAVGATQNVHLEGHAHLAVEVVGRKPETGILEEVFSRQTVY